MTDKAGLKTFISFLKERVGFTFDLDNFDHRIKLQKYVYIAGKFGWNHNYDYNLYIRGPYSSSLADDYYNLETIEDPKLNMDYKSKKSFKELVINKDTSWLEVAATLLYIFEGYKPYYEGKSLEEHVINRTFELKGNMKDIICNVYSTLKNEGLILVT